MDNEYVSNQLFTSKTIPQFKIHQWLVEHGLMPQACDSVDFPARNQVLIRDRNDDWTLFTFECETASSVTVKAEYGHGPR